MDKLNLLLEASSQLTQERDLKKILVRLADLAKILLGADRCSIFLYDQHKEELWTTVAHGVAEIRVSYRTGIVGHVFQTGETVYILEPYEDGRFDPHTDQSTGYLTENILAVPLQDRAGKALGVFQVINKQSPDPYREKDIKLLQHLALYAGSTLENVILNQQLKDWNEDLERKVKERTRAVRNLLDNAGQGFLSFGLDLLVEEEYSMECEKIFGFSLVARSFPLLIYPDNQEQREFLEKIFPAILQAEEQSKIDLYLPLLPEEAMVNQKYISLDYRLLTGSDGTRKLMVILSDITEKRCLEIEVLREKSLLKLVLRVINQRWDFLQLIDDYRDFYQHRLEKILASKGSVVDIFRAVLRPIHNFKGNFAQLGMEGLAYRLHSLESELECLIQAVAGNDLAVLKERLASFPLAQWLEEEVAVLQGILPSEFFLSQQTVAVNIKWLSDLEKRILALCSLEECELLLPMVKRLRYKPFQELLSAYPDYLQSLAESVGKQVDPLVIEGGDMLVDLKKYRPFVKSLVHLFRNIIDHGLEFPEERLEQGKDEYGQVQCFLSLEKGKISLTISDDGRGIDLDKIKVKAVGEGILTEKELKELSQKELALLIFQEGVSTSDEITYFSGRGVGMSIIKNELEILGGQVEIFTQAGAGTRFEFCLPIEEVEKWPEF